MRPFGLLTASAVLDFVIGIGLILVPVQFVALYGVSLDAGGATVARLLGVMFLQAGLVAWAARGFAPESVRSLALVLSLGNAVGALVALVNQLSGAVGPMGWGNVLIFGFFAAAFWLAGSKDRSPAA